MLRPPTESILRTRAAEYARTPKAPPGSQAAIHSNVKDNHYARLAALFLLVVVGAALVTALGFHQGKLYAAKRLTITLANEGCFTCWAGLTALKETNHASRAELLDSEMDLTATMLAGMALKYPNLIQRQHYNLLLHVRDYRKAHGRDYDRSNSDPSAADVDRSITEAVAYLESIHKTNQWGVPTLDEIVDRVEKSKGRR